MQPEQVVIWPQHAEAWELFSACATQWRIISGMAGASYQGLDYQALGAVRVELEMAPCKQRLHQVRHIEAGALSVMREQ